VQSNWTQHLINYAFWLFIDLQGVILQISLTIRPNLAETL